MNNIIQICILVIFLLTDKNYAAEDEFKQLLKLYPHAAIVDILENTPKIIEIVYSDKNQKIPSISDQHIAGFSGRYLVFLPAGDVTSMIGLHSYIIIDNKITIYKKSAIKPFIDIDRSVHRAEVDKVIVVDDLIKDLKKMKLPPE